MCADFSELLHHLAVMHAHIIHITGSRLKWPLASNREQVRRLALDLSDAAFQVSINAKELDAARRIQQIADDLI
jgi:hypothetical protein